MGSKTKLEKFDALDFRGALHWTFNFRCFDKDLCIKCFKNTKIQFEVTKRSQKQNWKITKYFLAHWTFEEFSTGFFILGVLIRICV